MKRQFCENVSPTPAPSSRLERPDIFPKKEKTSSCSPTPPGPRNFYTITLKLTNTGPGWDDALDTMGCTLPEAIDTLEKWTVGIASQMNWRIHVERDGSGDASFPKMDWFDVDVGIWKLQFYVGFERQEGEKSEEGDRRLESMAFRYKHMGEIKSERYEYLREVELWLCGGGGICEKGD
jgi:hypothetical protein